ncbi:MAG: VOC family protein [Chloroflexi bacterium]|nr:VOC family protein [Chloroflexota bacterium]
MLRSIHHVAIAVRDIDKAIELYSKTLGLQVTDTIEQPDQKVKNVFMKLGDASVELIAGLGPDNPVDKFIERKGEGLYCLSIQVDDLDRTAMELEQKGMRIVDASPLPVRFLTPRETYGVMIELLGPDWSPGRRVSAKGSAAKPKATS